MRRNRLPVAQWICMCSLGRTICVRVHVFSPTSAQVRKGTFSDIQWLFIFIPFSMKVMKNHDSCQVLLEFPAFTSYDWCSGTFSIVSAISLPLDFKELWPIDDFAAMQTFCLPSWLFCTFPYRHYSSTEEKKPCSCLAFSCICHTVYLAILRIGCVHFAPLVYVTDALFCMVVPRRSTWIPLCPDSAFMPVVDFCLSSC